MHNVALLSHLSGLTSLLLNMVNSSADEVFWRSLGHLTTLKWLRLIVLDYSQVGGIVALSGCQQLTYLSTEHEQLPNFVMEVRTVVLCRA